jgi:TonB-dependent starch-binding outer membrane protein SusC
MRRLGLIFGALLAVLWTAPARAQAPTGTIRGRVIDNATQQPLAGVNVSVGSRGAVTQANGGYVISGVPAGTDSLRARTIGYTPVARSVTIGAGQTVVVDLAMTAQPVSLSAIVATGYGEQRAGDITGAVTQVRAEEFNPGRVISPQQLIQSKVAGVQIVDNNEPGGGIAVRIRGATSINASSDPLYVVDGLAIGAGGGISAGRDALNFLNPNDIETITVLKGGEAASIYGANAANGVVIITTKSGRQGPPQVEYSTSASASQVTRLPSMLNASQFAAAVAQYAPDKVSQLLNANTNWFSLVDRTAYGQEHNLAVSGAGQSNNYRLSLGYLNQDGVIQGTTAERMSLGLDYGQRLFADHLNVRTNLRGSRSVDRFTPGGVLSNAAQMGPTQPSTDATSATGYYNWPGNSLQSADNPVQILALATDKGTTYRSIGNVQAGYRMPFFEALTANVNLGYDITEAQRESFNSSLLHAQLKAGTGGTLSRSNPSLLNTVGEAYLNYATPLRFVAGSIDLTGGYSYSQSHGEYPNFNEQNLSTGLLGTSGIPTAQTVQNTLDIQESKLISFFGRLNYNLSDRYLLSASVRRDGSSRFGPSNAWGTFPSAAVAWRISQEPFMASHKGLSDLKLRASWGKTGNQAFANYQQYAAFTLGDAQSQVQFGNTFVSTIRPSAVDPNIKWEQTISYNAGLDFGFHEQRFSGAIDWYNKSTSDLIFTVPVAAGSNFSNFLTTNIGSMKNTGIEFTLSARALEGGRRGLSWTANFTAARNTNQLTSINPAAGGVQKILTGGIAGGVGTTIQVLEPGQPINSFYVFTQKYDAAGKPIQGSYADSVPRAFHDPAPKWILGHSSYLKYGNWDASFTVRAWLGNYVYNNVASNLGSYAEVTRGSPYNLNTSVLTTGFTQPQYQSDYYVEDGSFLRMDNVTLGYTFQYRGQPLRLYATVQNAFTITGYSGVDPTAGLNGIDNNIYPRSRTWTGGMSIRF